MNEQTLDKSVALFGESHPNSLTVMTNLASDLAATGEAQRARELGENILVLSRQVRGTDHHSTLAVAANLSIDRRADNDPLGAQELYEDTVRRFRESLGADHPEARRAIQHGRLNLDIEPMTN
jgi:hypothetical protein